MAAEPAPLILYNPELTINDVTLKCLMSHVELTPDVTTIEVTTSCGVREYPGKVKWTLKASLYHSFDPEGTNEVLTAAVEGQAPVPFTVIPSSTKPIGADNPEYYGELIPQPFTPIAGDIGDASSLDLEWSILGWTLVPTTNTSPVAATGATAGTPGTWTPAGSTLPADSAAASAVTATPATAWTTGQWVQGSTAGAAGEMHWDGAAWVAGKAP